MRKRVRCHVTIVFKNCVRDTKNNTLVCVCVSRFFYPPYQRSPYDRNADDERRRGERERMLVLTQTNRLPIVAVGGGARVRMLNVPSP